MEIDPTSALNPSDPQRGIQRNRKSYVTRILEWYQMGDRAKELTEDEEEVRKRLVMAWNQLCKGYPREKVTKMIAKHFTVSLRQAQNDVNDAIRLYGSIDEADKEGMRKIVSEMALRLYRKGQRDDNPNVQAKALDTLVKVHKLDKDVKDPIDFSKLEQHLYLYVLDEVSNQALQLLTAQGGSINLSKFYDALAENVEVQEAEEEDDEDEV